MIDGHGLDEVGERMGKGRLEAFSDGVIAILITIMVLELRPPHDTDLAALRPLVPVFISYVISFVYLAIYWNNHHHLLQATKVIDGRALWANMFLLFWLSLVPFATAWMGEGSFKPIPTAVYACVLLASALSYSLLVFALRRVPGQSDTVRQASGVDRKGLVSLAIYASAILVALVAPLVALAMYVVVALIWFIPDQRVERALGR